MRVLCSSLEDPAAQVTQDSWVGSVEDSHFLKKFAQDLDGLTFESEFVDASLLINLKGRSLQIHPSIENINEIRDRKTQKKALIQNKIPTSPVVEFQSKDDLIQWLNREKKPLVLKKRLFGYDGYGTFIVKTAQALLKTESTFSPEEWIAEEFLSFKKELAFSIARNQKNQFYVLPLVETKQTNSKCDWVKGPLRHPKSQELIQKFKSLMKKKDYCGLLSVELFQTSQGLVVNELAPRVHNSAHYSIEALMVSQFEAHLRGVLNWKLPSQAKLNTKAFAMANLIGHAQGERSTNLYSLDSSPEGSLHWYNKKDLREGRKMGHLTVLENKSDEALKKALNWRKKFWL